VPTIVCGGHASALNVASGHVGAASGLAINAAEAGAKGLPLPVPANHIRVTNVLFQNLGAAEWGTGGKLLRITNGVSNVEITNVTSTSNPNGILDPQNTTTEIRTSSSNTTSSSGSSMESAPEQMKGSRPSRKTSRRSSTTRTCWSTRRRRRTRQSATMR